MPNKRVLKKNPGGKHEPGGRRMGFHRHLVLKETRSEAVGTARKGKNEFLTIGMKRNSSKF